MTLSSHKRINRTYGGNKLIHEVQQARQDALCDYPTDIKRPTRRRECAQIPRPCPFVSCRYNLYFDLNKAGGLVFNFPHIEPDEMEESCALDVAEQGPHVMEELGVLLGGLTRQRIDQILAKAKRKVRADRTMRQLAKAQGIKNIWR